MRPLIGFVTLGILAVACAGTGQPSGTGVPSRTTSSAVPSSSPTAPLTPVPAGETPTSGPSAGVAAPDLTAGTRQDVAPCEPLALDLASTADAGIICRPDGAPVELVAILRYPTQDALVEAYLAQVEANGLALRSHGGRCEPGAPGEGAYVPEDASLAPDRSACHVDSAGKAHYVATIPPWVMIQVTGTGSDPGELQSWAWQGNQDQPGNPTVWRALP